MIELHGIGSPNVMKVVLMLEELGLEHEFRWVNVWAQEQFADGFLSLNPNGKVPVLVDGEGPAGEPIAVFESGAILVYLAEKSGRFLPSQGVQRYACLQWLMLQMASIGPAFGQATHFRRSAPAGNGYALSRFVTEAKRLAEVVESRLASSAYLAGDAYTIADMAVYPWFAQYLEPNGIARSALPGIDAWLARVEDRAATRRVAGLWATIREGSMQRRAAGTPEDFDRLFGRGRYARD